MIGRRLFSLMVIVLLVSSVACSSGIAAKQWTNEQLDIKFSGIFMDTTNESSIGPVTEKDVLSSMPIFAEVEPISLPKSVVLSFTYTKGSAEEVLNQKSNPGSTTHDVKYVEMTFKVLSAVVGTVEGKEITVLVPERNSSFMDCMKTAQKYLIGIIPVNSLGVNKYDTVTAACFYISETNQIVPFLESMREEKTMGMTIAEFRTYADSFKKG